MICFRYKFLLLFIFIFFGSFSYVIAQSRYDFKKKSTNIREGDRSFKQKKRTYEEEERAYDPVFAPFNKNKFPKKTTYQKQRPYQSEDRRVTKSTKKIRFRYLSGTYKNDYQEGSRLTYSIIWDGAGIGQSAFKYKTILDDTTYELEHKSLDVAYTFGDEYTLTFGSSAIYSGTLTATTDENDIYESSSVTGYGYFSVIGIEFGIFEILFAYQYVRFSFVEIESDSTSSYMSSFKDSGNQYATGIGISF